MIPKVREVSQVILYLKLGTTYLSYLLRYVRMEVPLEFVPIRTYT